MREAFPLMSKTKRRRKETEGGNAQSYFNRARRFYTNARKTLGGVKIRHERYQDDKPVREASQMAYVAVQQAIKGALAQRGATRDQLPRREDAFLQALSKLKERDGKLPAAFNTVYENLHVFAHYDGGCHVPMVKGGMKAARLIIERLTGTRL